MSKLNLISTGQCAKILGKRVKQVRNLLQKHRIDFVRDNHEVYKVSLSSTLSYAKENGLVVNSAYLEQLEAKLKPWYQDKEGYYAAMDEEVEDGLEEGEE